MLMSFKLDRQTFRTNHRMRLLKGFSECDHCNQNNYRKISLVISLQSQVERTICGMRPLWDYTRFLHEKIMNFPVDFCFSFFLFLLSTGCAILSIVSSFFGRKVEKESSDENGNNENKADYEWHGLKINLCLASGLCGSAWTMTIYHSVITTILYFFSLIHFFLFFFLQIETAALFLGQCWHNIFIR